MIHLRSASKSFAPNNSVLSDIHMDVARGDFLFVVGDSGAGKTTLLKLLSGDERPSSGSSVLWGDPHWFRTSRLLKHRRRMGVIPQDYRLLKDRTVFENVAMPLFFGRAGTGISPVGAFGKGANHLVEATLQDVGLSLKLLHSRVSSLSGGEQQRVAIARGIINHPDILVADEPTGSLDHDHTWKIMDLLQKLNLKGMTIILATHDREIVRRIRKRTVHLKGGTLRLDEREGACIF